jgi:hypothetical protein
VKNEQKIGENRIKEIKICEKRTKKGVKPNKNENYQPD